MGMGQKLLSIVGNSYPLGIIMGLLWDYMVIPSGKHTKSELENGHGRSGFSH